MVTAILSDMAYLFGIITYSLAILPIHFVIHTNISDDFFLLIRL